MSSQTPPDKAPAPAGTARGWLRRLRALPGFKVSLVAFLVTVLVGGGTIAAVANWQQSSTATIAITAGAAPWAIGSIPGCSSIRNPPTTDFTFTWPAATNASGYAVTFSPGGQSDSSIAPQSVPTNTAVFKVRFPVPADGTSYVLRIQPVDGVNAGEAVYSTVTYVKQNDLQCTKLATARP